MLCMLDLLVAHLSWVGSVLYRRYTIPVSHNGKVERHSLDDLDRDLREM